MSAIQGHVLVLNVDNQITVLDASSGQGSVRVQLSESKVAARIGDRIVVGKRVFVAGRDDEPVDFVLAVPGKISRRYHGTLEIKPQVAALTAVVSMDLEAAVASVVAAESLADTPAEALKAQSVATRSYMSVESRHRDFDFCDTTHCQFLKELPPAGSRVANAVAETRGLVLTYNATPFPAMYTRSCGGRTYTPQQVGLDSAAYPYYSVECIYCRNRPAHWITRLSSRDAASLRHPDEPSRLDLDRRLGWGAVPSNDFVSRLEGDTVILLGKGYGHGIGLCQAGARVMAANGSSFRDILAHYYPNTKIVSALPADDFVSLHRH